MAPNQWHKLGEGSGERKAWCRQLECEAVQIILRAIYQDFGGNGKDSTCFGSPWEHSQEKPGMIQGDRDEDVPHGIGLWR